MEQRPHSLLQESSCASRPADRAGAGAEVRSLRTGFCSRIFARLKAWVEVPFGYEDANGFHYGKEPVPPPPSFDAAPAPRSILTDRASEAMTYPVALGKLRAPPLDGIKQTPAAKIEA